MEEPRIPLLALDRLRMTTDGAGVTTLICSVGCPLRCRFCINPGSWDGTVKGKLFTAEQLYEEVKIDNLYFLTTGGGLTIGGGEPLLHSKFWKHFMEKYKDLGWKFYIESSLSVPRENLDDVIPYIDEYFIDSKDLNEERYVKYTGGDYKLFYDNLMYLKDQVGQEKITVRVPVIPFLHKTSDEANANGELLKSLGFTKLDYLQYVNPGNRKDISEVAKENQKVLLPKKEG